MTATKDTRASELVAELEVMAADLRDEADKCDRLAADLRRRHEVPA
jgi:hypothetical protein